MLQLSTAPDLPNIHPYEAHHIVFSDADIGVVSSSSESNTPLCEELDTLVDEDVESNQDAKVMFPSDVLTSNPDDPGDEPQLNSPQEGSTTTLRVHFRPRVRITSGLNRHHRKPTMGNHQDYLTFTPSSSTSSSPSSSISAPLRTPLDDEVGKPGWGTLGQRVGLFARRQYPGKSTRHEPEPESGLLKGNEQTPLLNPSLHLLLRRDSRLRYFYHNGSDEEISRWIDRAFGPWPARLWNHHWWKWKLEPLMTCQCPIDCGDDECL